MAERRCDRSASATCTWTKNHQNGDFAPYLLKSIDSGRSWRSIAGDLPARGSTYSIAEDHVDPSLLFAGTEFAAYWSKDGGQHWIKIAGVPTIAVREVAIQIKKALDATPPAPRTLHDQARSLQRRLAAILVELQGDRRLGSRSGPAPVAISERANTISSELNRTLARPTMTHEQQYQIASELFAAERAKLKTLVETEVPAIERELERLGAPYTPGRLPR